MINIKHNSKKIPDHSPKDISRTIAFHEAGLAAAIHFGNRQKQLPPVFFQIDIWQRPKHSLKPDKSDKTAKLEGGRLIHTLPDSLDAATKAFSNEQKTAYESAFEADIFNMLAGPVAQACYVSLRDNEIINSRLMNLDALRHYGDGSDFANINEYLKCMFSRKEFIERKMRELFRIAFSFVCNQTNWYAICALAEYILLAEKNTIAYDEIVAVLETGKRLITVPYTKNIAL